MRHGKEITIDEAQPALIQHILDDYSININGTLIDVRDIVQDYVENLDESLVLDWYIEELYELECEMADAAYEEMRMMEIEDRYLGDL